MSKKHHKKQHELEQELLDYKNKYLYQLADAENARKRLQKDKEETLRFALENVWIDLLPIIDNFENALKFSRQASPDVQTWAQGFQMILSQFQEILQSYGIISYISKGTLFDPNLHQATEIVETLDFPENTIIEELSKGYKTEMRTLRPAQVKVARRPPIKEEILTELKDESNNITNIKNEQI